MNRSKLIARVEQARRGIITVEELHALCTEAEWSYVCAAYPSLVEDCTPLE